MKLVPVSLDFLKEVLASLEEFTLCQEGEHGVGRSLAELEADDELPSDVLRLREIIREAESSC